MKLLSTENSGNTGSQGCGTVATRRGSYPVPKPWIKIHGYHQASLRDGRRSGTHPDRTISGMGLLECMVYIVLLMGVMVMAYTGFYGVLEHTTRLARTASDINRALQAGEQWRADVRGSAGLPKVVESGGEMVWRIPQGAKEVMYLVKGDTVYRQEGSAASPRPFLVQVKSSRMLLDQGAQVSSCRWEVELDGGKKPSKLKPLFTFQAVPGK